MCLLILVNRWHRCKFVLIKSVVGCEHLWEKKSVCTFPPLASCRLSWIDLTGKSGVVPHPNQTPVVSNRRFVPNGCDLHPTTMYLCDCVIMYFFDCVIMYLCNYVFCIQTQCGCFVPNGCDLHPLTMYICAIMYFASKHNVFVFCTMAVTSIQQQCILICK